MTDRKTVRLVGPLQRRTAAQYLSECPDGWTLTFSPPKRTDGQNDRFHAICTDLAKSGLQWAGKPRTAVQWKVLLVSGHAKVTDEEFELVPGLESEFVNLRESTALMSVRRGASLIEYAQAFAAMHGVPLHMAILEEAMPC